MWGLSADGRRPISVALPTARAVLGFSIRAGQHAGRLSGAGGRGCKTPPTQAGSSSRGLEKCIQSARSRLPRSSGHRYWSDMVGRSSLACSPVSGAPSETVHLSAIPKSFISLTNISWAATGCQALRQTLRMQQELDRQVLSAHRELTYSWAC